MSKHIHDWRLMRKSNVTTRFKNAPATLETLIDLVLDPGDSSELWTCPDCGEDRYKYRPGFMQLLFGNKATESVKTSKKSVAKTKPKGKLAPQAPNRLETR